MILATSTSGQVHYLDVIGFGESAKVLGQDGTTGRGLVVIRDDSEAEDEGMVGAGIDLIHITSVHEACRFSRGSGRCTRQG